MKSEVNPTVIIGDKVFKSNRYPATCMQCASTILPGTGTLYDNSGNYSIDSRGISHSKKNKRWGYLCSHCSQLAKKLYDESCHGGK